jgi:Domain of unknown function (DUF4136)
VDIRISSSVNSVLKFIAVVGVVSLTACSASDYTVKSEKLKKTDFKTLKSYAWLQTHDSIAINGIDQVKLSTTITDNVDLQFTRRGIVVDTKEPDILVRYDLVLHNSTALVSTPIYDTRPAVSYGVGYSPYGSYGSVGVYTQTYQVGTKVEAVNYRNGSLVVELYERTTGDILWRGYAYGQKEANGQVDFQKLRSKVPKIVDQIFWRYPVHKKSGYK